MQPRLDVSLRAACGDCNDGAARRAPAEAGQMGRLAAYPNHVELGDRQGDGQVASGSRTRSAPSHAASPLSLWCFLRRPQGESNLQVSFAIESRIKKFPSQSRNPIHVGKPLSAASFLLRMYWE